MDPWHLWGEDPLFSPYQEDRFSSRSYHHNAKELYVYSVSSSNPSTYQWINVTLRALTNNWSVASNYNKRVKIEVQQYTNGSWKTASFSDYDLSHESYTFSTSDNWIKTFNSLVRFRTSWEFRLMFTEDNDSSVYWTKTINVGWSSSSSSYSSSYNAKELYVYSVSSSNPSTNQWISVTLRALANNWSIASNYNKRVRIEVQEYRNGSWRSASSSDYDLDRSTYTFSTSDNWVKTFSSLVRFRTNWEFRLKFTEDNDSSVYWTRTINVGWYSSSSRYYDDYYYDDYYRSSNYYYGNFTDSELKKISYSEAVSQLVSLGLNNMNLVKTIERNNSLLDRIYSKSCYIVALLEQIYSDFEWDKINNPKESKALNKFKSKMNKYKLED